MKCTFPRKEVRIKPGTVQPPTPTPTGIDYLELTERTHHLQVRADRRIGYDALFSDTADEGQSPGQLSIDDVTNVEDLTHRDGTSS